MIKCKNGVWVNPLHVVTVSEATDRLSVCVRTADGDFYTDLPIHVVISLVVETHP